MVRRLETMEELLADLDRTERAVLARLPGDKVRKRARVHLPHRVKVNLMQRVGYIRPRQPVRILINKKPRRAVPSDGDDLRAFIESL